MKRILMILALAVTVSSLALGQTADKKSSTSKAEQEVMKVFKEYSDAIARQDASAFERLLTDDYTFTTPDGLLTKLQKIALVKSGDVKIESGQRDDVKVCVYGGAAVVTSQYTLKGTYKGQPFAETGRSTATFVKRAGRWQFVADHTCQIAQQ